MINLILIIPVLVSFFITLFLLPFWIRKAKEIGLVWDDMNKTSKEKVSGSGGIMVILGFVIGVLFFVAYRVFILKSSESFLIEIFAALTAILILASVGFIDDLFGWRKGGLSRRSRLVLVLVASIPLVVINAGKSSMNLPFLGHVDLGIIYSLVFIPIGIAGATTTFNFLAGFNGLEAGQGILLLFSLAVVSFFTGNPWLTIIALCMTASLFAFLVFNFCPAKVFPGDSLTYGVGGLVAIMAVLGNFEKIAVFFFIPTMIEVVLKGRGGFTKQSFGKPKKDGTLEPRYEKIYGLTHLGVFLLRRGGIKATEKRVVYLIWTFQLVIILAGFVIFRSGIAL
jgi:UDP-N-acetylglucosamine--dolichyl-phosphate N-acetylglucosaminephosphotransferase